MVPLTGLDQLFIILIVESTLQKPVTGEDIDLIKEVWEEICFIYKDDPDTLNQLTKLINEPPNTGI